MDCGDPKVISMRCLATEPEASYEWHSHAFAEFTLVTDDQTVIGYPPGKRPSKKGFTLIELLVVIAIIAILASWRRASVLTTNHPPAITMARAACCSPTANR